MCRKMEKMIEARCASWSAVDVFRERNMYVAIEILMTPEYFPGVDLSISALRFPLSLVFFDQTGRTTPHTYTWFTRRIFHLSV